MQKEPITVRKVKKDLQQIADKRISRAWKGYGSALFLELGELHNELAWEKEGKPAIAPTGEWTLSSEGSWKLTKNNKEVLDAENASKEEIIALIKKFEGLHIKSIVITNKLELLLSDNSLLEFNKADYGFFTLVSNVKTFISYEQNTPYIQSAVL